MLCTQMRIKITVYIVTSVFSFILNCVSTNLLHENEIKEVGTDAFHLQEIKYRAVFLCFDIFYSLIFAAVIIIYLSFVILNDNLLKYVAVTANCA